MLDLRDTVRELVSQLEQPDEIWFFGSREQQTGSKRSDVDLLLIDRKAVLTQSALTYWRSADAKREPLDLFLCHDDKTAISAVNGSRIRGHGRVVDLLGARLLWSRSTGIVEDTAIPWRQDFAIGVNFKMTILPSDFSTTIGQLPAELARMKLPDTLLGTDWASVALRCASILEGSVDATQRLVTRAKNLNRTSAYPNDEYDVHNLFYLTLRPWLPDLELNPFQVKYSGQQKYADLAAAKNQLVIEAKFVSDTGSAAAVVKQLSGLADFYNQAPNVRAMIFAIVVGHDAQWDSYKIDNDHTVIGRSPVIVTKSIRLPSPP